MPGFLTGLRLVITENFHIHCREEKMKMTSGVMPQSVIGLHKAVKLYGSAICLAKKIGVTKQRINSWMTDSLIPKEYAERIAIATDNKVTVIEIRPDCRDTEKGIKDIYFKEFVEKLQNNKGLFL